MADITNIDSGSVVTFSVKVDGKEIQDTSLVRSIRVFQSVNRISSAEFVILDGNPSQSKFEQSSSDTFLPGKKVSIAVGYDSKNKPLYEGIITKQNITVDRTGSTLLVECMDAAVKLTVGRKSNTYKNKSDSDIIGDIIGNYNGVSSKVESTKTVWPEQVKYYATDWDFILARSQANGLIVNTINGKITVGKYDSDTKPVLEALYGDNIIELVADMDAKTQYKNVKASSWDFKTQQVVTGEAETTLAGAGNLSSKKLSDVLDLGDFELQSPASLKKEDLKAWSKAQILKSEYSKIQGKVKVQGTAKVQPSKYITLSGVGSRFNGDHFISSVEHEIGEGDWLTSISFGMSPFWFTENTDVMSPSASGLVPGVRGLYNATVKKINEDPDDQYRILIEIPLFDNAGEGIWARLSNFYSTSGAGVFFLPEVGDEVVIGFLNEDPRYPIILGSMYSNSKNKPFEGLNPNEKNTKKAIVSKSHIQIEFDDEHKILTINTPSKNTIVLDDKAKEITIEDQNKNTLVMSSSGIKMKSPKDIKIEAGGKAIIKGNGGVSVESPADVSIKGMNISSSANLEYSLKASAKASIQSGTQLTLQSAMIMIN